MRRLSGVLLVLGSTSFLSPARGWSYAVGVAYLLAGIVLLTGRR